LSSRNASSSDTGDTVLDSIKKQKDDADTLSWIMRQYRRCKSQRVYVERQWYVNLAFYFGKQNIKVIAANGAASNGFLLTVPKAPPWRIRMVVNRCRTFVLKQMANLTSQEPKFYSVPAGTSDEDATSARIAESIIDSYYREEQYKLKLRRLLFWGSICGTSFFKTYWDKSQKDANGNQGKITTDVIDPFHLYVPDLLQQDLELQPFLIHASTMSPEMVKRIYGVEVTANATTSVNLLEDQFLNLTGNGKVPSKFNAVLVLECWIKPGSYDRFPDGAMITVAGDKLVQNKPGWPYDHKEYPFAKFDDIDTGKFYGEGVLTDIVPLQREYNRKRSQIVENTNLIAKPKLLAPRGSINPSAITSEPGQVILYTPGFNPPTPLPIAPLPAYVENDIQQLMSDMQDLVGQHDLSHIVGTRTSATMLAAIQQQDALIIQGAATNIEQVTQITGRQVLALVKQFWTTTRTIKVVGYDEAFEILAFKNTDITSNTEVYVETGSALPVNRAGRQAFLMDAFKLGLIPDPNDVLDLMDIGGVAKIQQDMLIDQRQAQRENQQMVALGKNPPAADFNFPDNIDPMADLLNVVQESGEVPGQPDPDENANVPQFVPNTWDNHTVHIQIHNRFRKSEKFESLDDLTKKIFQNHVALHEQALQQNTSGQPIPAQPGIQPTDEATANAQPAPAEQPTQAGDVGGDKSGIENVGNAIPQGLPVGITTRAGNYIERTL
jgi:hypothetical protein